MWSLKEVCVNSVRFLIVTLCLVLSLTALADYFDPVNGNSPLATSMSAEAYTLKLVSTQPGQKTDSRSLKELLKIADDYQEIAKYTMSYHSFSLRAVLPVPATPTDATLSKLASPEILANKAIRFQEHALWLVNRLDGKIDSAYANGTISGDAYFELMDMQSELRKQISALPIPAS